MYGLIHMLTRRPRSISRAGMPAGSGNVFGSHSRSDHWYSRIQKQSKWKTENGISRSAMPSTNDATVSSSYGVVKDVLSHSPKDQAGGRAGRPVSAV
jgi:hypothetical protein